LAHYSKNMVVRNQPDRQSNTNHLDGNEAKSDIRENLEELKTSILTGLSASIVSAFQSLSEGLTKLLNPGAALTTSSNLGASGAEVISVADGLTVEQLNQMIAANPNLSFLGASGGRQSLASLMESGRVINTNNVRQLNYNFNALQNARVFPHNNGRRCCAFYVSNILGLSAEGSTSGSLGSVTNALIPGLIQRNLELNNNTGIIVGYKNFIRGDVMAFQGTEEYGAGRYGHTAIVRDTFEYNGARYMSIQHDSSSIQVEFIPVDPADADPSALEAAYNNPTTRSSIPALQSAYEYRGREFPDTVRFLKNRGYYGDASLGRGRGAFAVRTQSIVNTQRLLQS